MDQLFRGRLPVPVVLATRFIHSTGSSLHLIHRKRSAVSYMISFELATRRLGPQTNQPLSPAPSTTIRTPCLAATSDSAPHRHCPVRVKAAQK